MVGSGEDEVFVGFLGRADEAVLRAAADLLGPEVGFYPERLLTDLVANPRARVAVARGSSSGRVFGVGAGELRVDDAKAFKVFGRQAVADLRGHTLGVLSCFVVDPSVRHHGIARAIASAMIGWLAGEGCELLVVTSWQASALNLGGEGGLERLGFATRGRIDGETFRKTHLVGVPCPSCGTPCRCTSTLSVRAIR